MRGDLGSLYDAHADRLYAYCWSLVGDRLAAAALGDTFGAAVHQPPRGDSVLWLYSLSRTACAERGAFTGEIAARGGTPFAGSDPLLRAAAGLRSDHREVLLLWAGEWLEPHDIARVLGIAPDTVVQLLAAARTRLERAVLDILMRGTAEPQLDLIAAFEKGRLPQLLARRAPARAPGGLRERVLAACAEEAARPLPSVISPSPLVVIGSERRERPKRGISGGVSKGLGAAAGVAASAAAVIGLLVSWPAARGGGDAASMVPSASEGQTHPASARTSGVPQNPLPGLTGSERGTGGTPSASENPVGSAFDDPPRPAGGTPAPPAPPATSPADTPSPEKRPASDTPSRPEQPSTPPEEPPGTPPAPPTTTPPSDPATPPDDGSTPPATPPADTPSTPPADDSGTPSPSPTANPAPEPGQG
ncbi:RNA polymerase sigma factor [Actinomadura latina]|uniref:Sigma-70 family RNA polymerase sigma factor n=1 Tax=Actinomadura latina TaxID=163603 RepID=A0A846Z256_9ACTN|nr:hypothetical protein [Actinomadura latina]NKZ05987.1 hypothetical protein [Actinomadura latina]